MRLQRARQTKAHLAWAPLPLIAAVGLLALAGCGESSGTAGTTETTTTTVAAAPTPATTAPAATSSAPAASADAAKSNAQTSASTPAPAPSTPAAKAPATAAPNSLPATPKAQPATQTRASSAPAPAAPAPAPASTATKLSLEANREGQLKYNKRSLSANAGDVAIDFTNMAPLGHNVTVASASGAVVGATPTIQGRSKTLSLNLKPGTYKFYCSVPGHRMAGMEGTLTVK